MSYIIHIETKPKSVEEILLAAPPFSAASNIKDPAKILTDIQRKKDKYVAAASLNESCSFVCIAAVKNTETGEAEFYRGTEQGIFTKLLAIVEKYATVTFQGAKFIHPYIARRGLIYGLNFFKHLYDPLKAAKHIDIASVWSCGREGGYPQQLDGITSVLGFEYSASSVPLHELEAAGRFEETEEHLENTLNTIHRIHDLLQQ